MDFGPWWALFLSLLAILSASPVNRKFARAFETTETQSDLDAFSLVEMAEATENHPSVPVVVRRLGTEIRARSSRIYPRVWRASTCLGRTILFPSYIYIVREQFCEREELNENFFPTDRIDPSTRRRIGREDRLHRIYARNLLLFFYPLPRNRHLSLYPHVALVVLRVLRLPSRGISIMRGHDKRVIEYCEKGTAAVNLGERDKNDIVSDDDDDDVSQGFRERAILLSHVCAHCCSSRQILQRTRVLLQHQTLSPVLGARPPFLDLHIYIYIYIYIWIEACVCIYIYRHKHLSTSISISENPLALARENIEGISWPRENDLLSRLQR